jgi:hypothetical protein
VANVTPDLDAVIVGPAYNVLNYVAGSSTSLVNTAAVNASGTQAVLSNNAITNTVYLNNGQVGQVVDSTSVSVYLNSAYVESKVLYMTGTAGTNTVAFSTYTGTGAAAVGSPVISSVTNVTQLNVGDIITVAGAGAAGAALTSSILSISGTAVTLADSASTLVASGAITRTSFNNLNPNSSTLRVETGDVAVVTYGSTVFNTSVLTTTGTGNTLTGITLADVLPVGITTPFTVSIRKTFNNLLLPLVYNTHTNYSLSNVTVDASVVINPLPVVSYGTVISGTIHLPYIALRTDLSGGLIEVNTNDDIVASVGAISDSNPLALGASIALANTVSRVLLLAVASNDSTGFTSALQFLEHESVYSITPLTQDVSILASVKDHVEQMSTPEYAAWRIALVNTAIPTVSYVGAYSPSLVNANSGNNSVALLNTVYTLTSSNSQFVSSGVVPGDVIKITSHAVTSQVVTSVVVTAVLNNQQVQVAACPIALTAVNFYVQRNLSKLQQAQAVAAQSTSFTSHRVFHIQPDTVGVMVSGVVKYLPGYYAACAIAGLIAGLPSQQSLTNIGIAGISDLQHSNRYFTRSQLSTISAAGTFLLVQEAAGTIPYCRHSLSTDMSVLEYRELQQVKNMDFLSYFFHDILKAFPGRYNITSDTLQILRTTIVAGAKLLQGKRLPKIGAPLLDYSITSLAQDTVNKDNVVIQMTVSTPTVANYISLYLVY